MLRLPGCRIDHDGFNNSPDGRAEDRRHFPSGQALARAKLVGSADMSVIEQHRCRDRRHIVEVDETHRLVGRVGLGEGALLHDLLPDCRDVLHVHRGLQDRVGHALLDQHFLDGELVPVVGQRPQVGEDHAVIDEALDVCRACRSNGSGAHHDFLFAHVRRDVIDRARAACRALQGGAVPQIADDCLVGAYGGKSCRRGLIACEAAHRRTARLQRGQDRNPALARGAGDQNHALLPRKSPVRPRL